MRILFLTHSFNSLAQRLHVELSALGHELAVELDIADAVTVEAVALFKPDLVIAPFLKRAIPEAVWRHTVCLIVHPGIVGDRGPSALDWAITEDMATWGVTVLQAEREMDAGPVWATETFTLREATKSSLYRREVTDAAVRAVIRAVAKVEAGGQAAGPADLAPQAATLGRWRPAMRQADRHIDWAADDTRTVLRKIRAADGTPGVLDALFGIPCHLFDAQAHTLLPLQPPGNEIGRRHDAVLRSTRDGAVWIGHVRRTDAPDAIKLPTALAFPAEAALLPEIPVLPEVCAAPTAVLAEWQEIVHQAHGGVGALHFDFHNGAMSTAQCQRLGDAIGRALARPEPVLVLLGGPDFWCNGIHLNVIEAADSPADESWRNIVAMDDLTRQLIDATDRLVIVAMQGNAGAGGVFMALAADRVWAHRSVVLNPHYKNMGNLHGSEYWTYLLPRRLRSATAADVMDSRLPMSAPRAQQLGLLDDVFDGRRDGFVAQVLAQARSLATSPDLPALLQAKRLRRQRDEAAKPLSAYRDEELARMHRNFYGFDPSYHIARSNFVRRVGASWTPRHLSVHRTTAGPAPALTPATFDATQ